MMTQCRRNCLILRILQSHKLKKNLLNIFVEKETKWSIKPFRHKIYHDLILLEKQNASRRKRRDVKFMTYKRKSFSCFFINCWWWLSNYYGILIPLKRKNKSVILLFLKCHYLQFTRNYFICNFLNSWWNYSHLSEMSKKGKKYIHRRSLVFAVSKTRSFL